MKTHKELIVWQQSFDLCLQIYTLTKKFPKEELFVLVSQMPRCSISIPSNIAEGFTRRTTNDFRQFLYIAFGSATELETQLMIAKELGYVEEKLFIELHQKIEAILKMLNKLIQSLVTSR
jgi:four helix bundle protein